MRIIHKNKIPEFYSQFEEAFEKAIANRLDSVEIVRYPETFVIHKRFDKQMWELDEDDIQDLIDDFEYFTTELTLMVANKYPRKYSDTGLLGKGGHSIWFERDGNEFILGMNLYYK